MNLLAISDLHLNPESTERTALFLDFLEKALQAGDEVLVLGDLFDLWFGEDSLTFPFQRPILAQMKQLAARGLKMDYVEGNRDFFISGHAGSIFREVCTRGYQRQWGPRHLYAEHGDWINVDDWPYRTFRRLTTNRLSRLLLHHLLSRFLLSQAERVERRMKGTNLRYKIRYPQDHCRRFVEKKGREGADLVIVGHFHDERIADVGIQDRTVLFYNLPGWETGFRHLVIPEDGRRPHFSEKGRKNHGDSTAS